MAAQAHKREVARWLRQAGASAALQSSFVVSSRDYHHFLFLLRQCREKEATSATATAAPHNTLCSSEGGCIRRYREGDASPVRPTSKCAHRRDSPVASAGRNR
eukprot:TRINITY_DN3895_c0_g1_i2.p1 TRINITY_DN3895_c0_g1~~TRINITY_DN3895_c0_g1_i2.p1  ORF type:complete len:110 (-),score=19.75 TRINITY_DN3895_c0_g1_i2:309-617(-)